MTEVMDVDIVESKSKVTKMIEHYNIQNLCAQYGCPCPNTNSNTNKWNFSIEKGFQYKPLQYAIPLDVLRECLCWDNDYQVTEFLNFDPIIDYVIEKKYFYPWICIGRRQLPYFVGSKAKFSCYCVQPGCSTKLFNVILYFIS